MQPKVCSSCGISKPLSSYGKNPNGRSGVSSCCKACRKDKYIQRHGIAKRFCWLHKTCRVCGAEKHRDKFPNKRDAYDGKDTRCYSCKNTAYKKSLSQDALRDQYKRYRSTPERKAAERRYKHNSRKIPANRVNKRMSQMMRKVLRDGKAGRSWKDFVDYTPNDLRDHLEKQFTRGMDWEKFMSGEIHIDHIVPVSAFDLGKADEFNACWSLANLRPLWAIENIAKGKRSHFLL